MRETWEKNRKISRRRRTPTGDLGRPDGRAWNGRGGFGLLLSMEAWRPGGMGRNFKERGSVFGFESSVTLFERFRCRLEMHLTVGLHTRHPKTGVCELWHLIKVMIVICHFAEA